MQPYFDLTRKMTSKTNGRQPKKNKKMEDHLKKIWNMTSKTNGKRPKKKEDNLIKIKTGR
jgi:hypothetical protein